MPEEYDILKGGTPVISRAFAYIGGKEVPLSSFSYVATLGVDPSTGSARISGADISVELIHLNRNNIAFYLQADKTSKGVWFKRMRVIDILAEPYGAPRENQLITITFEDVRWRLRYGAVFGRYNWVTALVKDKIPFEADSLDKNDTPYSYRVLIQKIIKISLGKEAPSQEALFPEEKVKISSVEKEVQVSFDKVQLEKFDHFPLNKHWEGNSPRDVLAELLNEIDASLTVTPSGELKVVPIHSLWVPPEIGECAVESSIGYKEKVVPSKVYVMGKRVRDEIVIKANIDKIKGIETTAISAQTIRKLNEAVQASSVTEARNKLRDVLANAPMQTTSAGEIASDGFSISAEDLGLLPICPDISGKIRLLSELIERWGGTWLGASIVYQHRYGDSVWRDFFGTAFDDWYIENNEWKNKTHEGKTDEEVRAAMESYARDGSRLFPEEVEYIKKQDEKAKERGEKFDVLTAKEMRAKNYFFRLFRIPDEVEVNYDWSGNPEIEQIKKDFFEGDVKQIPSGKTKVSRDFVLPICSDIEEDEIEEKDEEKKEQGKEQQKKGKSDSEKKQEAVEELMLIYGVKGKRQQKSCRAWGYSFKRDPKGVADFEQVEIKEHDLRIEWMNAENGVIYLAEAPMFLSSLTGFSEQCPYVKMLCPVSFKFVYERKDPRLGPLNFFIHQVGKPSYIPISNDNVVAVERIEEFVEYLEEGKTKNREKLCEIADGFAPELWEKNSQALSTFTDPSSMKQGKFVIADLIDDYPRGAVQSISWEPFKTTYEVSTDYIRKRAMNVIDRIRRVMQTKMHRSFDESQKLSLDMDFRAIPQTETRKEIDRRVVINHAHHGAIGLYDPSQREDVSFCEAELIDPRTHLHRTQRIGPILCREVTPMPGCVPVAGHLWWTDNQDHAGCGHTHAIGGFWYPYVKIPVELFAPKGGVSINPHSVSPFPTIEKSTTIGGVIPIKVAKFPKSSKKGMMGKSEFDRLPRDSNGDKYDVQVYFEFLYDNAGGLAASVAFSFDVYADLVDAVPGISVYSGIVPVEILANTSYILTKQVMFTIEGSDIEDYASLRFDFAREVSDEDDTFNGDFLLAGVGVTYACALS